MLRCAVLDDYQDAAAAIADWSRVDLTVFRAHLHTEDEVAKALAEFDVVVIMRERTPFPASLLARLPRLKLLITSGMRNASIDLKAAAAQGITVCGTASASTPPVELTWALILGLCRHLVPENAAFRTAGAWQSTIGTDLAGATLGLLGLGKIGTRVAAIAKAFGMEVLAWSQNLTAERAEEVGAVLASSKEELLAGSDIVSIHLALSDRTRGLVDAAALAAMKSSALLVNTSRAAIVDTDAMIAALAAGRLAGAGLDVFDLEPLPFDHPLRTLPTVLATPHLGYVTRANYTRYFTEAVEDIDAFVAGEPIRVLG